MFLVGLTGGIATGKSTVSNIFKEFGVTVIDSDNIARAIVEPGTPAWKEIRLEFGVEVFLENGELNREALGRIIFTDAEKRRRLNSITHPRIRRRMLALILANAARGERFVVLDIPLLFETSSPLLPFLSYVVVVTCPRDVQLRRLVQRDTHQIAGTRSEQARTRGEPGRADAATGTTPDVTGPSTAHGNDRVTASPGARDERTLPEKGSAEADAERRAAQRIDAQMATEEKCRRATHVIDNSGSRDATRRQVEGVIDEVRASWCCARNRAVLGAALVGLAAVSRALLAVAVG